MEPIPKVPKPQFDAVLSRLLSTHPLPLSDIRKKRERKPARRAKQ